MNRSGVYLWRYLYVGKGKTLTMQDYLTMAFVCIKEGGVGKRF